MRLRQIPGRLATGSFILHTGLEKWHGGEAQAKAIHQAAVGAFPFLAKIPPQRFLKLLAAGEMVTGTALLAPFVPAALAGATLTAFSGSLLTFYWRTPGMRKPGSVWATPQGLAVSKDVWMFGIGLGLIVDALMSDD
jgi:uncharacterized membrane protein YphA (DoxX/SURF4 family)